MKINLQEIGSRLREAREAVNLTLEKMQEAVGFSKSLISAAEKGNKKPSPIYLLALIHLFNIDVNYILTGKGGLFLSKEGLRKEEDPIDDASVREMVEMMRRHELVRYSMLYQYHLFKANHKALVDTWLEEL